MSRQTPLFRPTRAEVDLQAIRHNCRSLRALTGPRTMQLAVVKANAYGHGAVPVARACLDAGADWLGVALVEEGLELRSAGIDAPILVLTEPAAEAAAAAVDARLTVTVCSREAAEAVGKAALRAGGRHPVHLAVDTGMHREGVGHADAADLAHYVSEVPGCDLEGVWTHFAVAEETGNPATDLQMARFHAVVSQLDSRGIRPRITHAANSAGIMTRPDSHLDMVRAGIAVYGLYPAGALRSVCDLRPAMRLVSEVAAVRRVPAGEGVSYGLTYAVVADANVATVPLGYGDGYPRLLSNRAEVLLHGTRRPVSGRITMDQFMVDCADSRVAVGDEVVLIGRQGREEILADELADHIGTINYEVVCAVGPRVSRVYTG